MDAGSMATAAKDEVRGDTERSVPPSELAVDRASLEFAVAEL